MKKSKKIIISIIIVFVSLCGILILGNIDLYILNFVNRIDFSSDTYSSLKLTPHDFGKSYCEFKGGKMTAVMCNCTSHGCDNCSQCFLPLSDFDNECTSSEDCKGKCILNNKYDIDYSILFDEYRSKYPELENCTTDTANSKKKDIFYRTISCPELEMSGTCSKYSVLMNSMWLLEDTDIEMGWMSWAP